MTPLAQRKRGTYQMMDRRVRGSPRLGDSLPVARLLRPVVVALVVSTAGCEFGTPREDVPGDYLGDYSISLKRTDDSCGLDAPRKMDIKLSRIEHELYWVNGREVIPGTISDSEGEFSFETRVDMEIEAARPPNPGCTLSRTDSAYGTIDGADLDITGFEGTLSYDYSATVGSDCLDLILGGTIAQLPCRTTFEIEGTRTKAPDPSPSEGAAGSATTE